MTAREHAETASAFLTSAANSGSAAVLVSAAAQAHALTALALALTGGHDLQVKLTGWDGDYPLPVRDHSR